MLSVCCLSGGPPGRLGALLALLRPVADEIVVAVDDRVDRRSLGRIGELADVLVAYPFAEPVERPFAWLHSLCRGDWIFRIDDDEVPSAALLGVLAHPDEKLTHVWVPRRWLWQDGWLVDDPWAPDWQLRLVRPEAARFPGRMHIPVQAAGPHEYVDAPLYHLDLAVNSRAEREEKARRYALARSGLRLAGLPLNAAYYLPELRPGLRTAPLPPEDEPLIGRVRAEPEPEAGAIFELRAAAREEVDAHWADAPLADSDYGAQIEVGPAPVPVACSVSAIDVHVTNLGRATWPAGAEGLPEIRLAYRWEGSDRAGLRTPFPRPVGPGQAVRVPLSFEAPDEPGAFTLVIDVVHERHRWFGAEQPVRIEVRPRRRALILVGQPPGEPAFDAQVDELLAMLDPALEPFLVGPKPEWLRDRFGIEAAAVAPDWRPDSVIVLPAGRRRDRLSLQLEARRLRRHARG